jgi:putative transcriptional regulator
MGEVFESIKNGLEEAILHSKGKKTGIREFRPRAVDVKKIRDKIGLTQNQGDQRRLYKRFKDIVFGISNQFSDCFC